MRLVVCTSCSATMGSRSVARHKNGPVYECVVVDLNTQHDFFDRSGAHPVANAGELISALRHVIAWAKRNCAPVISSVESHRETELLEHGHAPCCRDGSSGQRKIEFTVFHLHAGIEVDNTLSCPMDLFREYQQVIFRKRTDDLLGNPKADRFFTQLSVDEFILFGISIEGAVKALALGLLARDKKVTVVGDACGYWNRATADLAMRQIMAKGGKIITVEELLKHRLNRTWRYPTSRTRRSEPDGSKSSNGNGRKSVSTRKDPLGNQLPEPRRKARIPKLDSKTRGDDP